MTTFPPEPPAVGWILYDESCGICRRGVTQWERVLRRRGFSVAPLQAEWVKERLGIPDDRLLADFRLLLADGSQLCGVAAYRFALRRIWWTWPVFLLSITPGFRCLFDFSYRIFSRNRHRVSDACGFR